MGTNGHEKGDRGFHRLTRIVGYPAGVVFAANSAAKASSFDRGSPYPPGRSRNAPFVGPAERIGAFWLRPRGRWPIGEADWGVYGWWGEARSLGWGKLGPCLRRDRGVFWGQKA